MNGGFVVVVVENGLRGLWVGFIFGKNDKSKWEEDDICIGGKKNYLREVSDVFVIMF